MEGHSYVLIFRAPHISCIFKIDPPKIKPLRKLYPAAPHWDVINDRSLKQKNRNHEQDHADFSLSRKQRTFLHYVICVQYTSF